DVVDRPAHRHLGEILTIVRRYDSASDPRNPGGRRTIAEQGAQQRGLAGAVRSDEYHVLSAMDGGAEVRQQGALRYRDLQALCHEHLVAAAVTGLEPQRHHVLIRRRRTQARKTSESRPATLCLTTVDTRDVAADELLLLLDLA